MPFYVNVGYKFALEPTIHPAGSIILASALTMHTLDRRKFDGRYPHLANRLFDPQLYMAGLDPNKSRKACANLASYPWFGVSGLDAFDSDEQTQPEWRQDTEDSIHEVWPRAAVTDIAAIQDAVRQCVDFQVRLGCSSLILPSPLTIDPGTDYSPELAWLDSAIEYTRREQHVDIPIFATVGISDGCLRFLEPSRNPLLDLVLDSVSARPVDGVYIVLEQSQEAPDTKHCGLSTPLISILHLAHLFAKDSGLRVGVNFLGPFGLACEAAGAEFWATGWYRSLYRCRLADQIAGGRAFPVYWSFPAALDIHLESEFDQLARSGTLATMEDLTAASQGLLMAARARRSASTVPAWRYSMSNVASAQEHFLISAVNAENEIARRGPVERIEWVSGWLQGAAVNASNVGRELGAGRKTKTGHVQAWADAFAMHRRFHNV